MKLKFLTQTFDISPQTSFSPIHILVFYKHFMYLRKASILREKNSLSLVQYFLIHLNFLYLSQNTYIFMNLSRHSFESHDLIKFFSVH